MSGDAPKPGWYPDPEDDSLDRYWDGAAWTERKARREEITDGPPLPPPPRQPPPPPSPEATSPEAEEPRTERRSRKRLPLILAAVAGVLVIAGVAAFLLLAGDDSGEVIRQPVTASGEDPFTDSVANMRVEQLTSNGTNIAGEPVSGVEGGDRSVESVDGAAPGLYGGTEQEDACDPDALVDFLEQNPDKAQAWADAQGIEVDEIGRYVHTLTPVVLREDTRVTNNGFTDGRAAPFQAVLQAGTAVLVDDSGIPRVRCACGNPLSEPEATESDPEFTGEGWDDFDQNRLIAVAPAPAPVKNFRLVDVKTGREFDRPAGTPLTTDDLLNARIPACDQPVKRWRDGHYPDETDGTVGPDGPLLLRVAGIEDLPGPPEVQVGDFTGDGAVDGVVSIVCNTGYSGAGGHFETHAFDSSGEYLGEVPVDEALDPGPGTAPVVEDLRIADGVVSLTALQIGPGDALCCPSLPTSLTFEWTGSEFELAGSSDEGAGEGEVSDLIFDYGGVGPLRIGMTEQEAEEATGLSVDILASGASPGCYGVSIPELDTSLGGISLDGSTINSLASSDPSASTTEGITVGSSRSDLEAQYPDLIGGDESLSAEAEFLYTEQEPEGDTLRFLVGDADGVLSIETGRGDAVHLSEGCA